jgi:hypothetical protein
VCSSDGSCEGAGDDCSIGVASGDTFCWNLQCKEFGLGDVRCHEGGESDLRISDGLKRKDDSGGICHVCRSLDGEFGVEKETAEERLLDEEWSGAA